MCQLQNRCSTAELNWQPVEYIFGWDRRQPENRGGEMGFTGERRGRGKGNGTSASKISMGGWRLMDIVVGAGAIGFDGCDESKE